MRTFRDVLLLTTGLAVGAGALNAGVEWIADLHWTSLAQPSAAAALIALIGLWWTLPMRVET